MGFSTSFLDLIKKYGDRTKDALRSSAEKPSLDPLPQEKSHNAKHPPDRPLD